MAQISLVPHVDPSMALFTAPTQLPKPMIYSMTPLRAPQTVPLVDPSKFPPTRPFSSLSLQIYPPMVLQMYPLSPQQMAFKRASGRTPLMPSTIMASPIPSPIMTPPRSTQMDPSMHIHQMGASMPFNIY